jgi:DNA repair exonuclease SbcCD ATPase subunit
MSTVILGPQGEVILSNEVRETGQQCSSFLKKGTDCAALRGPQGEILLAEGEDGELAVEPEDGKCPTCGQDFPDAEDEELEDARDDIKELSA